MLGVVTSLIVAGIVLAYAVARHNPAGVAAAFGLLVFAGLFAFNVQGKLRDQTVALAREGEVLVGAELNQSLPIAETTFEIVSDYNGSWIVVLRSQSATIRLSPGGWRMEGTKGPTKYVVVQALRAMGLHQYPAD
jgi:hypothetical protein